MKQKKTESQESLKRLYQCEYSVISKDRKMHLEEIRKYAKTYPYDNIDRISKDYLETNILFLTVGLRNQKTLHDQVLFLMRHEERTHSWVITDTTKKLLIHSRLKEDIMDVDVLLSSNREYLIRYGYLFLMDAISEENLPLILSRFQNRSDYYAMMVQAWLLSVIAVIYFNDVLLFLKESNLSYTLKSHTISKILDSYRITKEEKEEIRKYRKELNRHETDKDGLGCIA